MKPAASAAHAARAEHESAVPWPPLSESDRRAYREARKRFEMEGLKPLTPAQAERIEKLRQAFAATAPFMRKITPVVVNSRAELVEYLRKNPIQLRAVRPSPGPRVGHPDFIGPVDPDVLDRSGRIRFEADGTPFFVIEKEIWEYEGTIALLRFLGDEQ